MAKKKKVTTMAAKEVNENAIVLLAYYKHDGIVSRVLEEYHIHPVSKAEGNWVKIQHMEGMKHFAYVLAEELTRMPEGYTQKMAWH